MGSGGESEGLLGSSLVHSEAGVACIGVLLGLSVVILNSHHRNCTKRQESMSLDWPACTDQYCYGNLT